MPSTFSPSLKIELIANGEQAGTWGQTTNNNLGTLIEQAIAGVDTIDITGVSTYTLSNYNGIYDEARNAGLIFSGTLTANCTVTTPAVEKLYVISNQTTGGYYVTVTSGSGNTISVASGTNQLMYCDGTNYNTAISNINNVAGDLTVTGSILLGANLTSTAGNLTLNAYSNVVNMGTNTGALIAPIGTTAQRPTALVAGMVRWNTTTTSYEVYTGSTWINLLTGNYSVNYLMVAAGGGGGYSGGGGGAGGLLAGTTTLASGTSYSVVIGSGGAGGINTGNVASVNGSNSTAFGLAAIGGGAGGCGGSGGLVAAGSGGSGGGGGRISYTTTAGGSGTSGQGNAGGNGASPAPYPSGGGGGAGASGGSGSAGASGNGGAGTASSISGSSVYYAGGGGGGTDTTVPPATGVAGTGGNGGGGDGGPNIGFANNGTANTGGGGGGGNNAGDGGGTGGSGIVIISYPGTQRGSGGTITSASNNTIHTFTSSGTYIA
jgi:hypothetical protein